jgi:4-hydroxy-tetrahydrodipicolinate synthase
MELVIGKVYPLSSKYFLNKRGLPIEVICRSKTKPLTTEQTQTLDEAHKVFLSWCERLDIKPVG